MNRRANRRHPCLILLALGVGVSAVLCLGLFVVPYVVWDFSHGTHSELVRLYGTQFEVVINNYQDDYWRKNPPVANDPMAFPPSHVEEILAIETYTEQCSVVFVRTKIQPAPGQRFGRIISF